MAKFLLGAVATAITATAIIATPASAITNDGECAAEGGTMVNVKGSDFCLVPIRPEAYRDEIYNGNQLGVTDCPGDKLNDGLYCMYPVTIRPQVSQPAVVTPTEVMPTDVTSMDETLTDATPTITDTVTDTVTDAVTDSVNDAVDDAIDSAVDTAVDTVKDEAGL